MRVPAFCSVLLPRLWKEEKSSTATEFAIIGGVFFFVIFAIVVISVDLFWQMLLDDAVRNATRQVEIGKITTGTGTSGFEAAVCNEFGLGAPNCMNTLQYSVQENTYFGGITPATLSSGGMLSSAAQFPATITPSAAGAPEFLFVQVAYPLPFKILFLPNGVATENGTPSLYSVAAAAAEP